MNMHPERKPKLRDLRIRHFSDRYEERIERRASRFQTLVFIPLKSGVPLSHFHLRSIWSAFEFAKENEQLEADGLLTAVAFGHASQHILAAQESLSLALDAARFALPSRRYVQEAFLDANDSRFFRPMFSVNHLRNDTIEVFRELAVAKLENRVADTLRGACDWLLLNRRFPVFPHRLFQFTAKFKRRSSDEMSTVLQDAACEFHRYESLCIHVAKSYGIRLSEYKVKTRDNCVVCDMNGRTHQFHLKKMLAEIANRYCASGRVFPHGDQFPVQGLMPFPDDDLFNGRAQLPPKGTVKASRDWRICAPPPTQYADDSQHCVTDSRYPSAADRKIHWDGKHVEFVGLHQWEVVKAFLDRPEKAITNDILAKMYRGDKTPENLNSAVREVKKKLEQIGWTIEKRKLKKLGT